ncbi:basic proline-rich protein-like [Sorex fumeus]|uniref:basic proline-rich protein-like n=1 Tax=Sorex fumeus TaxID=62283 RepID=UPI0024ACA29D|nr:basic proline-rich protein-like [Sorex fumeus]
MTDSSKITTAPMGILCFSYSKNKADVEQLQFLALLEEGLVVLSARPRACAPQALQEPPILQAAPPTRIPPRPPSGLAWLPTQRRAPRTPGNWALFKDHGYEAFDRVLSPQPRCRVPACAQQAGTGPRRAGRKGLVRSVARAQRPGANTQAPFQPHIGTRELPTADFRVPGDAVRTADRPFSHQRRGPGAPRLPGDPTRLPWGPRVAAPGVGELSLGGERPPSRPMPDAKASEREESEERRGAQGHCVGRGSRLAAIVPKPQPAAPPPPGRQGAQGESRVRGGRAKGGGLSGSPTTYPTSQAPGSCSYLGEKSGAASVGFELAPSPFLPARWLPHSSQPAGRGSQTSAPGSPRLPPTPLAPPPETPPRPGDLPRPSPPLRLLSFPETPPCSPPTRRLAPPSRLRPASQTPPLIGEGGGRVAGAELRAPRRTCSSRRSRLRLNQVSDRGCLK